MKTEPVGPEIHSFEKLLQKDLGNDDLSNLEGKNIDDINEAYITNLMEINKSHNGEDVIYKTDIHFGDISMIEYDDVEYDDLSKSMTIYIIDTTDKSGTFNFGTLDESIQFHDSEDEKEHTLIATSNDDEKNEVKDNDKDNVKAIEKIDEKKQTNLVDNEKELTNSVDNEKEQTNFADSDEQQTTFVENKDEETETKKLDFASILDQSDINYEELYNTLYLDPDKINDKMHYEEVLRWSIQVSALLQKTFFEKVQSWNKFPLLLY